MRNNSYLVLAIGVLLAIAGAAQAPARPGVEAGTTPTPLDTFNPADFSPNITNQFFPQPVGQTRVFRGVEEGEPHRVEERVLSEPRLIGGVRVRVVLVNEFENGELVERTLDFYSQHKDGSVWYFGERVDEFEDGVLIGHSGQWLAFQGGALPGLFMPAHPVLGQWIEQERAPGIAEDLSVVVRVGFPVSTPVGNFNNCIKTRDFDPIAGEIEYKIYCSGVGLVRETAADTLVKLTALG
jgi:hypothetical protein